MKNFRHQHNQAYQAQAARNPSSTPQKSALLEKVRSIIRMKHYSIRTEQSYIDWIKRYIFFHNKRHPAEMGENEISQFLSFLAVKKNVASSTQNQALCALIFLYKNVLNLEIGKLDNVIRAKKPEKIPVVFTREEAKSILVLLEGNNWLMGQLMYGAGLRLSECIRLRIKDIDLGYKQILVRDGKGHKDRVTMLPEIVIDSLKRHLSKVKIIHLQDLKDGFGEAYLPYALARKYPCRNQVT